MTFNLDAEKSVLGSILISETAAAIAFSKLNVDDFSFDRHRDIFRAMLRVRDTGGALDAITLVDMLERDGALSHVGGFTYVTDLTIFTISAANIEQYIAIVLRDRTRREARALAMAALKKLEDNDDDDIVDFLQDGSFKILSRQEQPELKRIGSDALNAIADYISDDGKSNVPTGIYDLDGLMNGGMRRKSLIILAARPSMGKTALAMNIARNVAIRGRYVVMFSLEQSRDELLLRLVSTQGSVELRSIRNANLVTNDLERAYEAGDEIAKQPIFITDKSQATVQHIRAELMRHKLRNPLDLVIVDYLQIMGYQGKAESRAREVGDITGQLKAIAKDLDVPVLLLSQLNRESERRADKRPILADLRESGAIEQDADVVMFLHRQCMYDDMADEHDAELAVKKNRNAQTGIVELFWEGKYFKFTSKEWRV